MLPVVCRAAGVCNLGITTYPKSVGMLGELRCFVLWRRRWYNLARFAEPQHPLMHSTPHVLA